jgi:hypothetical protein
MILPANASFHFSCSSARGAILMLESQMSRHQVFHDNRFKNYLLQHCLSWYSFARGLGVQVDFGDVMVVTECSKTAAWASVVYSQSSKEFGMSFEAGGMFVPVAAPGAGFSVGLERIGPVEHRRSHRRVVTSNGDDVEELRDMPKDQTVFVKGYRLGSRSLYMRSLARKIIKTASLGRQDATMEPVSPQTGDRPGSSYFQADPFGPASPSSPSGPTAGKKRTASVFSEKIPASANVSAISPEYQVSIYSSLRRSSSMTYIFARTFIQPLHCWPMLWRYVVIRTYS